MSYLAVAVITIFVFTLVKILFAILQWVVEKDGDRFLRRQLDALYDQLDRMTVRQVAELALRKTLDLIARVLPDSRASRVKVVLAFLALNVLAYVFAQSAYCLLRSECGTTLGHDSVLKAYGATRLLLWFLITFSGSLILQMSSLWLTWRLLLATQNRFKVPVVVLHLLVALGLLMLVFAVQYTLQQGARYVAFGLVPHPDKVLGGLRRVSPYAVATLILALAASLPTVVYVVAQCAALLLRLLPDWMRIGLRWLVFRVTTDTTPVLERMGSVMGGLASLLTAAVACLKV